jgi:hypothetical protein
MCACVGTNTGGVDAAGGAAAVTAIVWCMILGVNGPAAAS